MTNRQTTNQLSLSRPGTLPLPVVITEIGELTTGTVTKIGRLDAASNSIAAYRFHLSKAAKFNLALMRLSANVDVWLIQGPVDASVFDPDHIDLLAKSVQEGQHDESINLAELSAGSYLVILSLYGGLRSSYTLLLSTDSPSNLLPAEENIGVLNNRTITFSGTLSESNTTDVYRFELSTDADFNLGLIGVSTDADVRLIHDTNNDHIVDVDAGEIVEKSYSSANDAAINRAKLSAGAYYVQVCRGAADSGYTLLLSTDSPSNLLPREIELGVLNSRTATFWGYMWERDTTDVCRFELVSDVPFNLALTGMSADANVRLIQDMDGDHIVDPIGESIAESALRSNHDEAINLAYLSAGAYYVQVCRGAGDTGYTLQLSTESPSNLLSVERDFGTLTVYPWYFTDVCSLSDLNTSVVYRLKLGLGVSYIDVKLEDQSAKMRLIYALKADCIVDVKAGKIVGGPESAHIRYDHPEPGVYYIQFYQHNRDVVWDTCRLEVV